MGWNKKKFGGEKKYFQGTWQEPESSWGTENSGLAFCGHTAPCDMIYMVLETAHK